MLVKKKLGRMRVISISYIKTNRHEKKKWYCRHNLKAIKAWDNHALKGFNKYTKACKNTLYKQTNYTGHVDSKTDFSWFWKYLVVFCNVFYSFVQRIPKIIARSIRKKNSSVSLFVCLFVCLFFDTVILVISCWVNVCLNMLGKIRWQKFGGSWFEWCLCINILRLSLYVY